ncbi:MAG: flagellar basal body rod protein FlgC [Candidatus Hydrogenedentes bacterium]|nr:flagellar basal body rod protein FlgC [Candidatus Hydrogenedentota bacterium]
MIQSVSGRDIALSGLKAQRVRMNVIALNIANAETTRMPEGGPFRRQLAVFRGEQMRPGANPEHLGVRVKRIITDDSPFRTVYNPAHPDADADGYVQMPNISMAVEMVDLISAQRAYDANIAVMVSERRMNQRALEIIQR